MKVRSRPVSRVLSRTVIHLGYASPHTSSDLPGNSAGHTIVPLFGLAPGGVYTAADVTTSAVRSYRTISPLPRKRGGIFSVALAVGSRRPGITWHPALWSPDFPPLAFTVKERLSGQLRNPTLYPITETHKPPPLIATPPLKHAPPVSRAPCHRDDCVSHP